MNSSTKSWVPAGNLSEGQARLLSVPAAAKPDREIYLPLLAQKLQALVDSDPKQALMAMEMSMEHAPELSQIALEQAPTHWGISLTSSDSMASLLSRLDWTQPGQIQSLPPSDLQSLLEHLE